MEQKEKEIEKKEAYEKPEVESEDCEIWAYGYSGPGPSSQPGQSCIPEAP